MYLLCVVVLCINGGVNSENLAYRDHLKKPSEPSFWEPTTSFVPPTIKDDFAEQQRVSVEHTIGTNENKEIILENKESTADTQLTHNLSIDDQFKIFLEGDAKESYPDVIPTNNTLNKFKACALNDLIKYSNNSIKKTNALHHCYHEEVVQIYKIKETGKILLNVIFPVTLCLLAFVVAIIVKECVAKQVGSRKAKRAGHVKIPPTPRAQRAH